MEALKRELKKVGSLSLFFFIGYGYIVIIMQLFLKEFAVDVSVFTKVVVYALVSAKSVAIMDMTPWMNRFSISSLSSSYLPNLGLYFGCFRVDFD